MYTGCVACCPLVSHVEFAPRGLLSLEKITCQTDGRTPDRCPMLSARRGQRNNGVRWGLRESCSRRSRSQILATQRRRSVKLAPRKSFDILALYKSDYYIIILLIRRRHYTCTAAAASSTWPRCRYYNGLEKVWELALIRNGVTLRRYMCRILVEILIRRWRIFPRNNKQTL